MESSLREVRSTVWRCPEYREVPLHGGVLSIERFHCSIWLCEVRAESLGSCSWSMGLRDLHWITQFTV